MMIFVLVSFLSLRIKHSQFIKQDADMYLQMERVDIHEQDYVFQK